MKTNIIKLNQITIVIITENNKAFISYFDEKCNPVNNWADLSKFERDNITILSDKFCNDNDLIKYSY